MIYFTVSSSLVKTLPNGLFGVFMMIAFVLLLKRERSSVGSNFQFEEHSFCGSVGFREMNRGVPPASFTIGS